MKRESTIFVETLMRTDHCSSHTAQTKGVDPLGLDEGVQRIQYTSHPAAEDPSLPVVIYLVQFSLMKMEDLSSSTTVSGKPFSKQ